MGWQEVLIITLSDKWALTIKLGPILILLLLLVPIIYYLLKQGTKRFPQWQTIEAEVKLGGIGKVKIKPSYEDVQVAHKAWVELATRKAGLLFDEKNDVIVEIYDSWYELFKEIRSLAKQIPAERARTSKDTQELIRILVEALNDGLRPHLTRWQAKFRRWYIAELDKHPDKTPQEIQRNYPEYQDLIDDLRNVNEQLVQYTAVIKKIAHGGNMK
jgi:hypothetical protein